MPTNLVHEGWRVVDSGTSNWLCWFRHRTYVLEDGSVRVCTRCGRIKARPLWLSKLHIPAPPPPPPDHYGAARDRVAREARVIARPVGTKPTSERLVVRDLNDNVIDVRCMGD